MKLDSDTIKRLLEHRLHQADISRLLHTLPDEEKTQLFLRLSELLRRTSALAEVANEVSDTLSLDVLFPRLMSVVTAALNADRSSLFLYDADTGELFSRVMQGNAIGEVRFASNAGIAGTVFTTGQPIVIADAYADARFNRDIDQRTGYKTRNILCVPMRNKKRQIVGVTQALNKIEGDFDADDQQLLEALSTQAAAALENAQLFEKVERAQAEEALLLEVVSLIASEIHLDPLLAKIVHAATDLLDAERGSLFLYDPSRDELYSRVAGGLTDETIRFPANAGIAGECFTNANTINIEDAYADDRFNSDFDRQTGYRTRNLLCMPVATKSGTRVGVMEILNKRHGSFTHVDTRRLAALCAQAAVSIENAQMFEDIRNARNYNDSILRSMSNGVLTLDHTGRITKVNDSAQRILACTGQSITGLSVHDLFTGRNAWIARSVERVRGTGKIDTILDTDLIVGEQQIVSTNLTTVPLTSTHDEPLGYLLVIEDITREKRLRNTMSRYMSKSVVDKLIESGDAVLGGTGREVSVLFSDIRGFATISEQLGARETVAMLNEYFTEMVDIVFEHDGILDKYIGDMIMAVFGSVESRAHDAENAVKVAVHMMRTLSKLNERRKTAGSPAISIGVGISTGNVVAGNIGSLKRLEYTVIGDRVNLAARLESANKYYGTGILICDQTAKKLQGAFTLRDLDLIRVRGMQQPVSIFEVLDGERLTDAKREALSLFQSGMRQYRDRLWRAAAEQFKAALVANPADRPSSLFLERSEVYSATPPAADWDGVWSVTS